MREDILIFDVESDDAERIHVGDLGFLRLGAYAWGDGPVKVTDDIAELVSQLERARLVVGHNIIGFDLAALRHHGLDVDRLIAEGRVVDTLLVARQLDPPRAQGADKGRYTLGALGRRLGVGDKLTDGDDSALQALAAQHGGYGAIPVDDPTYRAYAAQDVELTRAVAARLRVDAYARREMAVVWRFREVERSGVRVDVEAAEKMLAAHAERRADLLEVLNEQYGVPRTGGASPHQSAAGLAALEAALVGMGVTKVDLPRTAKSGNLALNKDTLPQLVADHPGNRAVADLVGVLTGVGESLTVVQQLLTHVGPDGRAHPSVSADQATGRLSITKPALTTAGKRSERLIAQRAVIMPDTDDEVLLAADLSGIDAAALAMLSGDPDYIAAASGDYHNAMAVAVFGDCGWDGAGPHPRRKDAKVLVHGINYGMGGARAGASAGIGLEEAKVVIARLDAAYPVLASWKARVRAEAKAGQVLRTPAGRTVRCDPGREHTQAPAFLGQSTARDLLAAGVLRMPAWLAARLRLIVHDEVVVSVPRDRIEEASAALLDALTLGGQQCVLVSGAPPVVIRAEVSPPGRNWAECYLEEGGAG